MMQMKRTVLAAAIWLSFLLCACGGRQYVVRSSPQVANFDRIAVFPLENLSGVPEAGDRLTSILVTQLHGSQVVNLVEPGEVQQFILRSRIRVPSQLDLDSIREASRQLNADGIIFGTVNEYNIITTDLGPLPTISLSVRLVNANSGEIAWSATFSLQGDFKETVFGIGRVNSLGELAEIVVDDAIEGLRVAMYPQTGNSIWRAEKKDGAPSILQTGRPGAQTPADLEEYESEKEKARTSVQQEWQTIRGLSK
jgi:TolB-like protein